MSTTYAQLFLRRDTDANRITCTPAIGEPFYTTDLEELWMGDGATAGGIFQAGSGQSAAPADVSPAAAGTLAIAPAKHFRQLTQRLTNIGAGGGAYTYAVTLARALALPGAIVNVYLEFPASANPTIQIKDLTGLVLIGSITNPNPALAAYYLFTAYLGPDGGWHKLNGQWIN